MDVLRRGTHPCLRIRLLGDLLIDYDGVPVDSWRGRAARRCLRISCFTATHRNPAAISPSSFGPIHPKRRR